MTRRRRLYEYLFVKKDPVLMAMPYRKAIGVGLMAVGVLHIILAFAQVR